MRSKAISFSCAECSGDIRVTFLKSGEQAKCPHCGAMNPVPGDDDTPRMPDGQFGPIDTSKDIAREPTIDQMIDSLRGPEWFRSIVWAILGVFTGSAVQRAESKRNIVLTLCAIAYVVNRRHIGLSHYMDAIVASSAVWNAICSGAILLFLLFVVSILRSLPIEAWIQTAAGFKRRVWLFLKFVAAFEGLNLLLYGIEAVVRLLGVE